MKFFGTGDVWDAQKDKVMCTFVNGVYETEDEREIQKLVEIGFKYEGELQVKLDKKEEEISELKSEVADLKKSSDPKALKKLDEKIASMVIENKELKDRLVENKRASEILKDKAVELGVKKNKIKDLSLLELCETFVAQLTPPKDK
jgi:predicted RNase H-like nuclease (RuvC/YqgF family)